MPNKISEFNISSRTFIDKIKNDLEFGVKVQSGQKDCRDIIRVWTDTKDWQFSVLGLTNCEDQYLLEKVQIQSFGESKAYIQLILDVQSTPEEVELKTLSSSFAELSSVDGRLAEEFMNGYMQSTFNKYLTEKLFDDLANDEDYLSWLVF